MKIPQEMKKKIPYDPAIPLLYIYTHTYRIVNMCINMFTEAVLTEATISKQPKCPLMNVWISKVWYLHTMEEYHSALKHKDIQCCATTWAYLVDIMLSEMA